MRESIISLTSNLSLAFDDPVKACSILCESCQQHGSLFLIELGKRIVCFSERNANYKIVDFDHSRLDRTEESYSQNLLDDDDYVQSVFEIHLRNQIFHCKEKCFSHGPFNKGGGIPLALLDAWVRNISEYYSNPICNRVQPLEDWQYDDSEEDDDNYVHKDEGNEDDNDAYGFEDRNQDDSDPIDFIIDTSTPIYGDPFEAGSPFSDNAEPY